MLAKEFIINKMNDCVVIEENNYKNYYHSIQIQRKKKLCKILNEDFSYDPENDINKKILFLQYDRLKIFYVDREFANLIEEKFNLQYNTTHTIIREVISKNKKLKKYLIKLRWNLNIKLPK